MDKVVNKLKEILADNKKGCYTVAATSPAGSSHEYIANKREELGVYINQLEKAIELLATWREDDASDSKLPLCSVNVRKNEFKPYSKMIKYNFKHLDGEMRNNAHNHWTKQQILEACDNLIEKSFYAR